MNRIRFWRNMNLSQSTGDPASTLPRPTLLVCGASPGIDQPCHWFRTRAHAWGHDLHRYLTVCVVTKASRFGRQSGS